WKCRMESLLVCKDLWPVVSKKTRPEKISEDDWETMNAKAVATMKLKIDKSLLQLVIDLNDAKEVWNKLSEILQPSNWKNAAFLVRQLVNLKYRDGESMSQHLAKFKELQNKIKDTKITEEEFHSCQLLSTLPDSWFTYVVKRSNAIGELTVSKITDILLQEEMRRKVNTKVQVATVEMNKARGRSKSRDPQRGKSHERRNCFHCGKAGHLKKDCRIWKR
ncbi:hypothetical protein M569_05339, partial [Genlisea aurea]